MSEKYIPISLDHILIGEPLPANIFVNIDSRFIAFRGQGDCIDRITFDRLEFKKVIKLFCLEEDHQKFVNWTIGIQGKSTEAGPLSQARKEMRRKTLDIFQSAHPDREIAQAIGSSKKLVAEMMKFPFVVKSLEQLQTLSNGTVDHSINVSVLATYLAIQMGYSHKLILEHVGLGALLHDLGKMSLEIDEKDPPDVVRKKEEAHPQLGVDLLASIPEVSEEVKTIVAQHHEFHDGSGYPKKLRHTAIYHLSRIVSIANLFDELVSMGKGPLIERQKRALKIFDEEYFRKFESDKHEKAVRILKLGI